MAEGNELMVGWASADITPDETVAVRGQFHARISEGIMDPITATALALELKGEEKTEAVVMVSCDLAQVPDCLRDAVRETVAGKIPELAPECICMSGTHTHAAPEVPIENDAIRPDGTGGVTTRYGVDLPVLDAHDYLKRITALISEAIAEAWLARSPGKIGYGLGHAVVGRNRRITYENGESRMYGDINTPEFSHVEGYEDHSVNLLGTWDNSDKLTGLVVNVACPSQVSENVYEISADYWHETRMELRSRLGEDLFVLTQCSAAGDQSPHLIGNQKRSPERVPGRENPEVRMWRLSGRSQREDIAVRIADAVTSCLPFIEKEKTEAPVLCHKMGTVSLSCSKLTDRDAEEARAQVEEFRMKYESHKEELAKNPEKKGESRWYVAITHAYRRMKWYEGVVKRYELQKEKPKIPVQVHVIRIGDVAFATNPFEYYLDFGMQIKARSRAVQTFIVQLTGSGTYVPTRRATEGGSYGAVPASNPIGPEGGSELVEKTVEIINSMWGE